MSNDNNYNILKTFIERIAGISMNPTRGVLVNSKYDYYSSGMTIKKLQTRETAYNTLDNLVDRKITRKIFGLATNFTIAISW